MRRFTKKAGRPAFFHVVVLVCLLVGGCIEHVFYYPDNVVYGTPDQRGLAFERVTFASRDGTRLTGWFIPSTTGSSARGAKGTVVHFHGNAQNMSAHWEFVAWLPARGYNVFVFDYRGYGASGGKPDIRGVFEDSSAALEHVRSRTDIDRERLLVLGQSLGGANAIAAVGAGNRAGIRALAIDSTFYSYTAIANDKLPGAGILLDDAYSAERHVAALAPLPLLLLHGTADRVIPYTHSQRLLAKARGPKSLISIPDGTHLDALTTRHGERYREALLRFFEAALRAPP